MESRTERRETEPVVDKIRRGEISVFAAVAEALPQVFRTHVVRKLGLLETLTLACVNKFYSAAVWSVEAVRSLEEKAEDYAKLHSMISVYPPLHICSRFNYVKAMKALISSGADLEERSREAENPRVWNRHVSALHAAAQYSKFEAAKLLLKGGADVNARTQLPKPGGGTPLLFAIVSMMERDDGGSPKLVSLLLEAGADVTLKMASKEEDGELNFDSILGYCICNKHVRAEVVKILLDAGADPNGRDTHFGRTPLHNVAMLDNTGGVEETVKIARMLLKYGADPLEEDKDGDTPLKCAEHGTEQQEMIDLLREAMKLCSSDRCWWEERIGLWL